MNTNLTPERFKQAREHFHVLLELSSEARRPRMDALESEDPELASVVAELLDHASRLEEEPEPPPYASRAARDAPAGTIIDGRYRILEQIGEGGMAEVYLAERTDDIAHKVALKLMRTGSRAMFRRFVRERQILARLNHPHIAHLTDGGLIDDGVPWFAMEHVEGERITDWCDRERLDLKARTHLFIRVCRAVQFAHRNLVLHRDIKPSNILVDKSGAPRLLDFGIAKLIDATDPEQTRTLSMTPAYAAPEQLRGEPVTTASDVYQLGMVLRELLTGVSAYELRRSRRRTADGTYTWPRLDQTYARCPRELAERIARARGSQPARLKHALRGDLDRIVQKACAEDPRERYDTAQALADDLQRWRRGMPVNAHRGSFAYRTGKLLRRHAIAASVVFLCAAGLVASTIYSYQRAESERLERQRSDTVLGFMRNVFRQGDPARSGGRNLSPAELLQRAAEELESTENVDIHTHAMLLTEIAHVFNTLARYRQAEPYAQQALDLLADDRERHANAYLEALGALVSTKRGLGLADEIITLIDQAMPLAQSGNGHTWRAAMLATRGYAYIKTGDHERARRDLHDVLSILDQPGVHDGHARALALRYLGRLASQSEDYEQSIEMYRQSVAAYEGAEMRHIDSLATRHSLVQNYVSIGQPRQAVNEYERLIDDIIKAISADDVRVSVIRTSLALAYAALGDYERAIRAMDAIPEAHLNAQRQLALQWQFEIARVRLLVGQLQFETALSEVRKTVTAGDTQDVLRDHQLQRGYWLWAEALLQLDRCDEAVPMLERLLAAPDVITLITADAYDSLGRCSLMAGAPDEAGIHFEQAVTLLHSKHLHGSPRLLSSEIHALWAQILSTRDPGLLDEIEIRRARLIELLGSEDRPVVWQLDLLVDELYRTLDQPQPHPERRPGAEAGLKALDGSAEIPHFVGLVSLG